MTFKVLPILMVQLLVAICFFSPINSQDNPPAATDEFPILTGPYLGQKPPGMKPELFAPEILVKSKDAHSNIVFTQNGTEAYWCYNGIWFSKMDNGKWTTPIMVPFSKKEFSDDAPFISPDGKRLFFASKRSMNNSDKDRKENIWVVDIVENGWSEARLLPPVINDMFQHWQVSVDLEGSLYFGHRPTGESDKDLYFSRFQNNEYQKPEILGGMINSDYNENNPYISPDGDYIIFTRINSAAREPGRGNVSLFISFKLQDDTWSQSIDLREHINYRWLSNCAIVSQDGNYLFFLDAYEHKYQRHWISAEIIEKVRASHPEKENFK